jgi:hypothetical protein
MNQAHHPELVRYLVFSASLRRESLNSELAGLAARTIAAKEGLVTWLRWSISTARLTTWISSWRLVSLRDPSLDRVERTAEAG